MLRFAPPTSSDGVRMARHRDPSNSAASRSYPGAIAASATGGTIAASARLGDGAIEERVASFVWANVVNEQCAPGVGIAAEDVRCRISFSSPTSAWMLREITGHWRDADNPLTAPQTFTPFKVNTSAEAISIPADGEPRSLDVAMKYREDPDCYAYNNDSYFYGNEWCRKPEHRIPVMEFIAHVTITGSNFTPIERRFLVTHGGRGTTLSIEESAE